MKKQLLILFFYIFTSGNIFSQGFAINTSGASAHTSAMLDVTSTSQGVLVPRMTSVQKTSIASPATGLIVYDTDLNQFYYYNGSAWTAIAYGSNANNYWTLSAGNIYNNTGSFVGIGLTSPAANLDVTGNNGGSNSLQLRSGNTSASSASNQLVLAYNNSTNFRHAIKSRHNSGGKTGNAIDFYTWNFGTDATGTIGTQLVATMDGNGYLGIGVSSPASQLANTATNIFGSDAQGNSTNGLLWTGNGTGYAAAVYNAGSSAAANGLAIKTTGTASTNRILDLSTGSTSNAAGTSVMVVQGNGNMGVGVSSPLAQLHINKNLAIDNSNSNNGDLTAGALTFGFGLSGEGIASKRSSGGNQFGLDFYTGSTNRMSISNGGNVGIGTSSPSAKLHVSVSAGNYQVTDYGVAAGTTILGAYNGSGGAGAQLRFTGAGAGFLDIGQNSSGDFVVEQSDAAKLTVTTTGNVGVGISSPSSKMVVAASTVSGGIFKIFNTNSSALNKWWLGFMHDNSLGSDDGNDRARVGVEVAPSGSGRLFFSTGGPGTQTEKMRIDESGFVGIATTAANSTLTVNGSVSAAVTTTASSLTLGSTHYCVIHNGGTGNTFTLPAASSCAGRMYLIINHGTDVLGISIFRTGNAATSTAVAIDTSVQLISDGTEWRKIN